MPNPIANAPSPLHAHLGYWLRLISNQVSFAFSQKLNATGVTVAEWVVLREMYSTSGETTPSTIAELTGLTRGAISKLISRLLEKGLVSRKESKSDRRFQAVKLSAKGIAIVPKLAALADQNDENFFDALSALEKRQLFQSLKKLAEIHQLGNAPIE